MEMSTPLFTSRQERKIIQAVMPMVLLPLVRKKIIREEHLSVPRAVGDLLLANLSLGVDSMRWSIAIEEEFLKEAVKAWKKGRRSVALVLYATALDQLMNQTYRLLLEAQ